MDFMLNELCNISGVSGYECDVANSIYNRLQGANSGEVYIDRIGNVILYKKGRTGHQKVMISAHMDEVGFQVIKEISDKRYRIKALGSIKTWDAYQQRVVSGNAFGVIKAFEEDNLKAHNYENLYLEIIGGEKPEVGDVFAFEGNFAETEKYYLGKALDNRLACGLLIDLIKKDIPTESDVVYVFSVQEEIGMRGVRVAKTSINPDLHICIDTTAEGDRNSVELAKGVAIKISDGMTVATTKTVNWLKMIAIDNKIRYQMEANDCGINELIISNELDYGNSEAGISIPCRSMHSANVAVYKQDYFDCELLMEKVILAI